MRFDTTNNSRDFRTRFYEYETMLNHFSFNNAHKTWFNYVCWFSYFSLFLNMAPDIRFKLNQIFAKCILYDY